MTVTATIFIHGRRGTFDQFDHMAASTEDAEDAFAFDWSEGRLIEWGATGFSEAARRSSAASVGVGAAVIKAAGQLLDQIDACRLASTRVVGHSKGGAVALQAIVEISQGAAQSRHHDSNDARSLDLEAGQLRRPARRGGVEVAVAPRAALRRASLRPARHRRDPALPAEQAAARAARRRRYHAVEPALHPLVVRDPRRAQRLYRRRPSVGVRESPRARSGPALGCATKPPRLHNRRQRPEGDRRGNHAVHHRHSQRRPGRP